MLDMSDRHTRAARRQADSVVTPLPVVALPPKGTVVRHQSGSLFRVEGSCVAEGGDVNVLFRALDPLLAGELQASPSTAFFAPAAGGQAKFTRLRSADPSAVRKHLSADILSDASLETILRSYDEPWRFFHTREHIYAMFEMASNRGRRLSVEQALAVLFHDVVYVPGAPEGHNEGLSVLLVHALKHLVRQDSVDWGTVCRIIEETATHSPSDAESAAVQDLDLASLALDMLHFRASNELVWLENRHLLGSTDARKDFDTRRLRFLLALATRGPLFSDECRDLEEQARENLENLRQDWNKKYGG